MSHPDFARISDSSFISEFFGIAKTVLTNPAATEQLTMQETLFPGDAWIHGYFRILSNV
jgi:hypothetical protein